MLVEVFSEDDAVVFSLLLVAVYPEPQPDRTTARAVAAAAVQACERRCS